MWILDPHFENKMGSNKQESKPAFMNNPTGAQGYNYASNRGPNAIGGNNSGGGGGGRYGAPSAKDVPGSSTGNTGYSNSVRSPARRNSGTRKVGGVGGSWGGGDAALPTGNSNRYQQSSGTGSGGNSGSGGNGGNNNGNSAAVSSRAGSARSDGAYETQLVDNICAPGGLRPRPAANDVKKFVARCKTLDPDMMVRLVVVWLVWLA